MNIKEEILAQVKKGKLDKALEKFEQWAAKNDDDLHHSVIMQLSRYNGLKRNEMMGLITPADANLTRNQITYALTSLLEELDDHPALRERGGGGDNGNEAPPPIAPQIRKLFISYAREDREYVESLERHLSALMKSGHIDSWTDSDILPGQSWASAIEENLRNADIILFMVSSYFLDSEYIHAYERKWAQETKESKGAKVVPVITRPCLWEDEDFASFQAVPKDPGNNNVITPINKWKDEDDAYVAIVRDLKRIIEQ